MSEKSNRVYGLPDLEHRRKKRHDQERIHKIETVRKKLGGLCVVEIDNDPDQIYGRPYMQASDPSKVWVLHS